MQDELMHMFSVTNVWTNFMSSMQDVRAIREQLVQIDQYLRLMLLTHFACIALVLICFLILVLSQCCKYKKRNELDKPPTHSAHSPANNNNNHNNKVNRNLTFSRLLPSTRASLTMQGLDEGGRPMGSYWRGRKDRLLNTDNSHSDGNIQSTPAPADTHGHSQKPSITHNCEQI